MVSFKELKSQRDTSFAKLNTKLNSIANPTFSNEDERFWQPIVDKEGLGYALIRFLPPSPKDRQHMLDQGLDPDDALPFFRYWDHGFQGPGGWYIENSLTSLGQEDPCGQMNSKFWNSGDEKSKAFVQGTPKVSGSKRRLHFISNIIVLKHPSKVEDEGKVFLYKYGKKIFDMINLASNPKFKHLTPFNPFDLWNGANFNLCIMPDDGYRSYKESKFDAVGPLFEDEDKMEEVWNKEYALHDVVKFKTYNELQGRLQKVMTESKNPVTRTVEEQAPIADLKQPPKTMEPVSPPAREIPPWESEGDEEDMKFFENLVSKK